MNRRQGFTLVELLVAIAIFAVLSALGWKVFDYISKVKERNSMHEVRLSQLQEAYQQILRDTIQAVPLTANINGDIQPAMVLQNGRFNFSKTGVTDPLNQGIGLFHVFDRFFKRMVIQLIKTKMTEQAGVQEVLIDGAQLPGQHLIEHGNDGFIPLHGRSSHHKKLYILA